MSIATNILNKLSFKSPEEPKIVRGPSNVIAQYVYQDIVAVKREIRKYRELTGMTSSNSLYCRIYTLLETDHEQSLRDLRNRFSHNMKCEPYYRELLRAYKKNLGEYVDLLDMFKNNHNHGIYEKQLSKRKRSEVVSSQSSIRSSTPEIMEQISDEAPDRLVDPISFNLFSDPVVTPNGISYERSLLMSHLKENGPYDPLTRQPLKETQLYPNLVLKDSVMEYIKDKNRELSESQLEISMREVANA